MSMAEERRERIRSYITNQTVGPLGGAEEEIGDNPKDYYISGVLFPREDSSDDIENFYDPEDVESSSSEGGEGAEESVSTLAGKLRPSSLGVEVLVEDDPKYVLDVLVDYATYEKLESNNWKRTPQSLTLAVPNNHEPVKDYRLNGASGFVRVIRRTWGRQVSVKIFVVNEGGKSECIFQPRIEIQANADGYLLPFTSLRQQAGTLEDRQVGMRHRKHKSFGSAFGCSVQWDANSEGICTRVSTTFVPCHEIKPITYDIDGDRTILSQKFLARELIADPESVVGKLNVFVNGYSEWIKQLPSNNSDIDIDGAAASDSIDLCEKACSRMKKGIQILAKDFVAREAFSLANLVMLMQSMHRKGMKKPPITASSISDYYEHYCEDAGDSDWRPFQLAFMLLSIEPSVNPFSEYREFVDLIWFPTGGGKTEAYLGVASFTILLGRLKSPDLDFGTSVISRYTLRLLTAQQFERTAALVCSLDLIRRIAPKKLGEVPISLGLWVGKALSPNWNREAQENLENLLADDRPRMLENRFILNVCPCCNRFFLPEKKSENLHDYGFSFNGSGIQIKCVDSSCPMSEGIPVYVVDQQIYVRLPTIVLGTIDKFATLAWREKAGALLTGGGHPRRPPPALIIQDELHLISGPLGSIAGIYEAAIEELCSRDGSKPHMIASTATVLRADWQCVALYGRHVQQFPPPGLDEADSFFAKKDADQPGRMYLGVLGPHTTGSTTSIRLHAILLQAAKEADSEEYDLSDSYWTLISYFNAKRELGAAATYASDDIPDRMKVIQPDPAKIRSFNDENFDDLFAEKEMSQIKEVFDNLSKERDQDECLSLVLSTNMISVGVDVDRLGIMLVNGQPQTTAEYIQSTSRVGRQADMPGLVVSMYSATKPRDRSHYEAFESYHAALYSYVEPTSVTPFSKPSRDRALHAALVILARYLPDGFPEDESASDFKDASSLHERIKQVIEERVLISAAPESKMTGKDLDKLIEDWIGWANDQLCYEQGNNTLTGLLHDKIDASPSTPGWFTMRSMRTVDFNTRMLIVGEQNDE